MITVSIRKLDENSFTEYQTEEVRHVSDAAGIRILSFTSNGQKYEISQTCDDVDLFLYVYDEDDKVYYNIATIEEMLIR